MGLLIVLMLLFAPGAAFAGELEIAPYYTRNQGPLVQIFGLPAAEGGRLAGQGRMDLRLVFDASNIFTGDDNGLEELRLDGETYRLTLALRRGLSERLEIGFDIPYVWHTGGRLDGVINGFHRTFDLPEGGRDLWYDDRLHYLSVRNGEIRLQVDEPEDGFGDLLLTAGVLIFQQQGTAGARSLALRPALKLPTGSSGRLTGSGSTDLSLRLAMTDGVTFAPWRLTWYGEIGGLVMTEAKVLEDLQQDLVGFGTLGFGWAPLDWLAVKVQLDGHTPFFHGSGLRQLDDPSLLVTFGFAFPLPGRVLADLAITEDLLIETAPDVVFHFALRRRF